MSDTFSSFWSHDDSHLFEKAQLPRTSFPSYNETAQSTLDSELATVLIISDANEVNENFSISLKCILDNIYMVQEDESVPQYQKTYHNISQYALKLLTSNLFLKNCEFCVGKILSLLLAFTTLTEQKTEVDEDCRAAYESECLKEFLCITLLLLLKLKNSNSTTLQESSQIDLNLLDKEQVYNALAKFDFVKVISNFTAAHIVSTNKKLTSFVLLKFSCDVFFEYLYHKEVFSDSELDELMASDLIATITKYLLSEDTCSSYEIDGDTFEDEDQLVVYEQFKLLLLINEQFLMKSYTCGVENKVFKELTMDEDKQPNNSRMVSFINLSIYHLNREESQIIKILILKFLYLVFTTENTKKLVYLNDLKILVDIFIRELNNLDYNTIDDTRVLVIDYLRVLYPMLTNTQLSDIYSYKNDEIMEVLRNLAITSENDTSFDANTKEQEDVISKLAIKCTGIPWLKSKRSTSSLLLTRTNSSTPSTDITEIGSAFTRIASVRTSTRADYHLHTTNHNLNVKDRAARTSHSNMFRENNNNLFLSDFETLKIKEGGKLDFMEQDDSNILDLPTEYLNSKPLPDLPDLPKVPKKRRNGLYSNDSSSSTSVNSTSLLVQKSLKKQAPPPPSVPQYLSRSEPPSGTSTPPLQRQNSGISSANCTPPPPPPPRRRRL